MYKWLLAIAIYIYIVSLNQFQISLVNYSIHYKREFLEKIFALQRKLNKAEKK